MKCLENFRELIQNKQVLLTMIHTLESQHGRFNMRDRFVGHLSLSLSLSPLIVHFKFASTISLFSIFLIFLVMLYFAMSSWETMCVCVCGD